MSLLNLNNLYNHSRRSHDEEDESEKSEHDNIIPPAKRPLKLLVLSGNLGNAEPDEASLAAWIPDDGNTDEFLEHQKYPVATSLEQLTQTIMEGSDEDDTERSDTEENQEEDPSQTANDEPSESGGIEVSQSERSYYTAATSANPPPLSRTAERFDLIVIGMQESTFEPKNKQMIQEIEEEMMQLEAAAAAEEGEGLTSVATSSQEDIDEDDEEGDDDDEIDEDEIDEEDDEDEDEISIDSDTDSEDDDERDATIIDENNIEEEDLILIQDENGQSLGRTSQGSSSRVFIPNAVKAAGKATGKMAAKTAKSGAKVAKSGAKVAKSGARVATKTAVSGAKVASKTATKTATMTAKVATKTAKSGAKVATKTAKSGAKIATKTAKSGAKIATKTATIGVEGVKTTGAITAKAAEKVARTGISTIDTLTASRDHTKDKLTAELFLQDGTGILHKMVGNRLASYTRLLSFQRGEMRLLVYSLNKHHKASIKSVRAQNTGMAGLANKGGIVAEVVVDKGTSLAFMSCHLEAHEGNTKLEGRVQSLADILKGTKKFAVPSIYPDASLANHYCFVLGDLNFRTRYRGQIKYEEQGEQVFALVKQKNWTEINKADELRASLDKKECLFGFQTLYCNFPPTFKVERVDGFQYKPQRTPSYTDRILWRSGDQLKSKIQPLAYEPVEHYTTSDHKPIRGAFEIELNEKVQLKKKKDKRQQEEAEQKAKGSFFSVPWGKKKEDAQVEDENLHIFVSEIKCEIFQPQTKTSEGRESIAQATGRAAMAGMAGMAAMSGMTSMRDMNSSTNGGIDTYVTLVSSPPELLLKKPTKWNQYSTVVKKFFRGTENTVDTDNQNSSTSGFWPRTSVVKSTYNPDFTQKELHCVVKTHQENGTPINLAGALLHIFVFKYNGRQTDEVVGSYAVNLEDLVRNCTAALNARNDMNGSNQSLGASSRRMMAESWKNHPANRMSFRSMRKLGASSTRGDETMVSIEIDGPLLKNGKQTGELRCAVDAWWVNDALVAANAASKGHHPDISDQGEDKFDVHGPLFASRHRRASVG